MSEPKTEVRLGLRHDPTNQWMMDGTEPKIFYDERAAARIANLQEHPDDWRIENYPGT